MRETKAVQTKAEVKDRTITGIASVFGNIDDYFDRMHVGSFTKTISEGRARAKHLWNHDFSRPPIASIKELREVGRDELPEMILTDTPEATGGLLVARDYYVSNELSELVFEAIKAGDVTEMSFGFDATKFDFTVEGERRIREIREVRLYDTSDVLWGMNNATVAQKSFNGMSAEIFLLNLPLAVAEYEKELKAGRRNAAADMKTIEMVHEAVIKLGFNNCEMKKDDNEKSARAAEEAEAASNSTSLDNAYFALKSLDLENLTG